MTNLFYIPECASTQDEIKKYLSQDLTKFLAIHTFNQTHGKGQYGKHWELQKNVNIAYSVAIPLDQIKIPSHLLNFHTAEIVADYVATLTNMDVQIKWPNDIILSNKKIAGLLIEKKIIENQGYYIIGIGLNVCQDNFENLPQAGSLLTQTTINFELNEVSSDLHEHLQTHLVKSDSPNLIISKLNARLFRKDQISVFQIGDLRQNGIIKSVDSEGYIWIDLENDGLKRFFHKEIAMLY